MNQEWTRIEGMIIGRDLDPADVARELGERGVLAQLEWFPSSPQLLGLNLAVADGAVAALDEQGSVSPGPSPDDLADDLAVLFDAEVRIGSSTADHLPDDDPDPSRADPDDDPDARESASRIVEIGRTPASSVPLLAALEGLDLGSLDLADDHRAILADLPPEKAGWNFGDLPLVTLSMTDGDLQAFLVTDDHLEHVVTHNWGMRTRIVPGPLDDAHLLADEVLDLVGDRPDLAAIADAVPGADADALWECAGADGDDAVWRVVRALGLPQGVAGFLLGALDAADVEGVTVHLARGISNAIGRSVDIMLGEPESPVKPLWSGYQNIASDKPWVIRVAATVEAIAGAGMLVGAIRAPRPRSGWLIAGGVVGGLLLVDSIAELSLAKYVAQRQRRRAGLARD
ncbi:hypothetical protein M3T53_00700 [Actinomyces sp. B33]|uniref:hypothetical protein n=1 Tax=Actinomyces sp. B33 TaxID=2942131 RepID=UPI0023421CF7|nr:hypothetical protein [Actinomyces sp. B33]MDC4232236.1 hypothetical protein [Actinomyces sp. B33]